MKVLILGIVSRIFYSCHEYVPFLLIISVRIMARRNVAPDIGRAICKKWVPFLW
jgi:hypothetical protein